MSEPTKDIPGGTVLTPHKAIRRIADHLVDHLDNEALDAPRGQAWTVRQIAEHVAGVTWYAEQVGRLGASRAEVQPASS